MSRIIIFVLLCFSSLIEGIPLNDLFPYGSEAGDSIFQPFNLTEGPFHLPYEFPYFDYYYRQISITKNGLLSFVQPSNLIYNPVPFSSLNESSFIAGYWHVNYGGINNKVYYQIHSTNKSLSNSTMKVLKKTSDYVTNFFPEQRPFEPKMVIIATWYYISMNTGYNATADIFNNTFQIVLCTDEDRSFAFLLYHDLQWSDPYNNTFNNYNARAGFHDSKRNISEILPYSGTEDIIKLTNESNVNVPGLFVFRIDADQINQGGCHQNTSTISFRPRTGSQLGSTPITIYGPCFTNQTKIKCRFGSPSNTVNGTVIDTNRAICLTTFASIHGQVPVSVSIDDGRTYISADTFTYAPLRFASDEVTIETEDHDNLLNVGQYVKLTWHFSQIVRNTFPNGTKIDIELWQITLNNQSQLQKTGYFVTLGKNLDLNDSVRVQLPSNISNISTCFIRIVAHFYPQIYAGLNTGLLVIRTNSSLAHELCQAWVAQQPEPFTWNNDGLLQCPMTHQQAIAAGRCCYKPDQQCYNGSTNPSNCWLHQARSGRDELSAVECYTSITTNLGGSGAECCYDNSGMIITRGTGAGTDDRYAESLSPIKHFFHDTLPYLQCCIMSTNAEMCNKYMQYRPPRRGSNTMGETGRMWGDPHFGTLDGMSYTFNGHGEYTYLAITNNTSPSSAFDINNQFYVFMSQIRTAPLPSINATVTKGFAARSKDVEAESVSATISRGQHLILRRENKSIEFEDNIDTLYFPELTITRLDGHNNSHFSFAWTIGVTIEINVIKMTSTSEQLVLNIAASISGIFRGKTYGLLGTYDGTPNNDLRSKNGTIISSNASLERIHNDFGMTWSIDPLSSLFYYESNQSAALFQQQNRLFIPSFIDPTVENNSTIRNACKIDATSLSSSWTVGERTCYYDLLMTHDLNFARASLNTGIKHSLEHEDKKNPPLFPSSLPLRFDGKHGQPMSLTISATSEYSSHVIQLSALHRPENSTFNQTTGIFNWIAVKGEEYLSIEARDINTTLRSQHDILFYVNTTDKPIINPGNGMNSPFDGINYSILIFAMIILFDH